MEAQDRAKEEETGIPYRDAGIFDTANVLPSRLLPRLPPAFPLSPVIIIV